jgi:hypothetical protein
MKKMKIAMIVSAIIVAAGLALALVGLLMMRFDWKRLDFSHYQSKNHEISEDFNSISINVNTADVILRLSKDGVCRVSCFEDEQRPHTVTVQDGRVAVTASDCPGSDCVHSGWAKDAGRAIICLPNRMEIRLTGSSDVDVIVG